MRVSLRLNDRSLSLPQQQFLADMLSLNKKRRSVSWAVSRKGHAASNSFTSALAMHPYLPPVTTDASHSDSFIQKMGYFRRKGSISLSPIPIKGELVWKSPRARHRGIIATLRRKLGLPLTVLVLGLSGAIAVFLILKLVLLERFERIQLQSSLSGSTDCEPFSTFGNLEVDPINPDVTAWHPFDTECLPPNYFRKLRHKDLDDMGWIRNRTILLIGDTIEREHVEQFCVLMGQTSEVISESHPWSPHYNATKKKQKKRSLKEQDAISTAALPRACYLPDFNFLLTNVYHFGLDQEDYWSNSAMYNKPGLFEHRLSDLFEPYVKAFVAAGRATPDLIEVASGAFDLMRWARQDAEVGRSTTEALHKDRLQWFKLRFGQIMQQVHRSFPLAKGYMWRSMHYPQDQAAELVYYQEHSRPASAFAALSPHFSLNRVSQLDQVARSAAAAKNAQFRLNSWGTLMLGHAAHEQDALHVSGGSPATVLWSEIILYELRRAIDRH